MAFDRFEKRKKTHTAEKPAPTAPFVVCVNPYVSLQRSLELMARISSAQRSSQIKSNLREVEEILKESGLTDYLRENRKFLYNQDLELKLQREITSLLQALDNEDFGNIPRVKVVVAGSFNAGKSSFLNYLIGRNLLPEAHVPATAVPTFLFCRNHLQESRIYGENKSGAVLGLDENVLLHISHANESGTTNTSKQIAATLERFIVEIPHKDFQNIVFIDTPGFGNKDSENAESGDDKVAADQMANAEVMIYLKASGSGGLSKEDWERIEKFGNKPVIIILTKNDLQEEQAAREVFDLVVDECKNHTNVSDVVSLSVQKQKVYFARSLKNLRSIVNDISLYAPRDTEIERIWKNIHSLLSHELQASEGSISALQDDFKKIKKAQNEVNKQMHILKAYYEGEKSKIDKTLLYDINNGIALKEETFSTLNNFYKCMDTLLLRLRNYYNARVTGNSTILDIIESFKRNMGIYNSKITELKATKWGYQDAEDRNLFVGMVDNLIKLAVNAEKEKYSGLEKEGKDIQERIKEEKQIIDIFLTAREKLSAWKNNKVMTLKPVEYTKVEKKPGPYIFDALKTFDHEMLINALSEPSDLTTSYNKDGYSPITYAASIGNLPALRFMLEQKSKGEKIKATDLDARNRTMAMAAQENNQTIIIDFINNFFSENANC